MAGGEGGREVEKQIKSKRRGQVFPLEHTITYTHTLVLRTATYMYIQRHSHMLSITCE